MDIMFKNTLHTSFLFQTITKSAALHMLYITSVVVPAAQFQKWNSGDKPYVQPKYYGLLRSWLLLTV